MIDGIKGFTHIEIYNRCDFFWSIARRTKSVLEIRAVSVECHLLLPLCFADRYSLIRC